MINVKIFNQKRNYYIEILLILFPIFLIFSSAIAEIIIFLLIISYLKFVEKKEFLKSIKEPIILTLVLVWFYLIINYLINLEKEPSLLRTIFFFRFILLILAINYFTNVLNINLGKIFKYLKLFIIFISIDLFIQFFFSKNIFGFESRSSGENIYRLGGMMNDELKISFFIFYIGISVFSFYFLKYQKKNSLKNLLFLFMIFISIFITGERSNLISMIMFLILTFVFIKFTKKNYITIYSLIFISLLCSSFFYKDLTSRMIFELPKNIKLLKIEKNKNYFNKDSQYFSHYSTAYQIFKNHQLFGVGIKNFRNYCNKDIYKVEVYKGYENRNCRTHPHNFFLELLSETGLVGFLLILIFFCFSFFTFLLKIIETRDHFLMINFFSILIYFVPILPRGSFFNNWNAMIFWFIFALIYSRFNFLNFKND